MLFKRIFVFSLSNLYFFFLAVQILSNLPYFKIWGMQCNIFTEYMERFLKEIIDISLTSSICFIAFSQPLPKERKSNPMQNKLKTRSFSPPWDFAKCIGNHFTKIVLLVQIHWTISILFSVIYPPISLCVWIVLTIPY